MTFWNYVGEFLLFRWLSGKFKKSATKHDAHTDGLGTSVDIDSEYSADYQDEDIIHDNDSDSPVGDDLIDDSDNSEELDDLDIFMRDNNGNNRSSLHHGDYGSDYHSRSRYRSHCDWDSGSYHQSFDDFHDEQDDYDMMDDDF